MKVFFYNSEDLLIDHIFQGDAGIKLQIISDDITGCNLIYFGHRNNFSLPVAVTAQEGIIDVHIPDELLNIPDVVIANICVQPDDGSIQTKETVYIPIFVKQKD